MRRTPAILRKLAAILVLVAAAPAAQAGAVVVGANSTLPAMNADEARRIFVGIQRNVNGQTVAVLFQQPGPAREEFDSKVLGMTGADLSAYLAAMIFTGRAVAPTIVPDDAAVKRSVIASPDTVGYVSDAAVDATVRVLLRY